MGHASTETEGPARRDEGSTPAPAEPIRLCGRATTGIDAKSRVVMPAAFRAPFADRGGLITPWRATCLAAMAPLVFDAYTAGVAADLAAAGEDVDRVMGTLWSSTVPFTLDLQGRLVLPEEVRSQVGITDEVRFQGRGRRLELWPGQITAEELDERADHLATLGAVQRAYIPEIES